MMKTTLLALCVTASFAFGAAPAPAAPAGPPTVVKEATGEAAIVNGDLNKAYNQATEIALREAVSQAAGVAIEANSLTKNSILVRDEIAAHSQGYVKSYDTLSKSNEKGVVKVTVKAVVATAEIDKDLAMVRSIVGRLGRSKLLIVTQETLIDQKGINTKGEQLSGALLNVFRGDGWRIIDEKGTGLQSDKLVLSAGTAQGTVDKKEIAKAGDVDYLIYGTVSLRYVAPSEGGGVLPEVDPVTGKQKIFFVEGQYDLAMLETRTGRNLAKVTGKLNIRSKDIDKVQVGYEYTAKMLAETEAPLIAAKLRAPVMEYLRDQVVNGSEVELKVSGLPNLKSVEDMQKELMVVHGVKDARPNGDFSNGSMVFTLHVDGTAYDLGQALDQAKVLKQKLKVTTKSVSNNQVEIALAK